MNDRREARDAIRRIRRTLRPLRTEFRQFRHRAGLAWRWLRVRHQPRIQLFVVAEPRTGSNLLISYLNSLTYITALEEILNVQAREGIRRYWISRQAILRHIDQSLNESGDIVAAKLMIHHLRWRRLTANDLLARYPNARFVILYRRDLVRQYVSVRLLQMTGQERYREKARRQSHRLTVDPDDLRDYCRKMKREYLGFLDQNCMPPDRYCIISYEELAENPQLAFDQRISPLLDGISGTVRTRMTRQNPEPCEDLVTNYEDIRGIVESGEATLTLAADDASLPDAAPVAHS